MVGKSVWIYLCSMLLGRSNLKLLFGENDTCEQCFIVWATGRNYTHATDNHLNPNFIKIKEQFHNYNPNSYACKQCIGAYPESACLSRCVGWFKGVINWTCVSNSSQHWRCWVSLEGFYERENNNGLSTL